MAEWHTSSFLLIFFIYLIVICQGQNFGPNLRNARCGDGPDGILAGSQQPKNLMRLLSLTVSLIEQFPWIAKVDLGLKKLRRRVCPAVMIAPSAAISSARCMSSQNEAG